MSDFSRETELLYVGDQVGGVDHSPETLPIYQTTAVTSHSLEEALEKYDALSRGEAYSYIRTSNPNRSALAHMMSYLEHGEASLICSAGMGAITSTLLALLKAGDHVVYSNCCYGESLEIMTDVFAGFNVEISAVNIDNLEEVQAAIRPNTKIVYTEVVANPLMRVADIDTLAKMAHEVGALLIVDNTFTTPFAIRPLDHGADIVINSLTKFLNGHSDACAGSVTSTAQMIAKLDPIIQHCGTPGDPFTSWLVARSLKTAELRLLRQMDNAAKLAKALEQHPCVEKVYHPCIESFFGHETAERLFECDSRMVAMLSIVINTEDYEKRNEFSKRLRIAHYAATLGGVRTTYQQPIYSSQSHMPDAERRKIGITPAMFRISVGIENIDDLIADFTNALDALR